MDANNKTITDCEFLNENEPTQTSILTCVVNPTPNLINEPDHDMHQNISIAPFSDLTLFKITNEYHHTKSTVPTKSLIQNSNNEPSKPVKKSKTKKTSERNLNLGNSNETSPLVKSTDTSTLNQKWNATSMENEKSNNATPTQNEKSNETSRLNEESKETSVLIEETNKLSTLIEKSNENLTINLKSKKKKKSKRKLNVNEKSNETLLNENSNSISTPNKLSNDTSGLNKKLNDPPTQNEKYEVTAKSNETSNNIPNSNENPSVTQKPIEKLNDSLQSKENSKDTLKPNEKLKDTPNINETSKDIPNPNEKSEVTLVPSEKLEDNKKLNSKPRNILHQFPQERELKAYKSHEKLIQNLIKAKSELSDSLLECEYDNSCETTKKQISMLQGSIEEYHSHIKVYEFVKSRAYKTHFTNSKDFFSLTNREIYRLESPLTIYGKRLEIEALLDQEARVIIIYGQSWTGISTQIPQYVADHPKYLKKRIICTQPRNSAVLCLANRVAFEYGAGVSPPRVRSQVRFNIGGENKMANDCRIEFVTENVLLQKMMNDDKNIFQNVGCIIIDEIQERNASCDVLLAYFKKKTSLLKDVLLIILSSSRDQQKFSRVFPGVPCLEVVGTSLSFPVNIEYLPIEDEKNISNAVAQCAINIHLGLRKQLGDILCFLPSDKDVFMAKHIFENEVVQRRELQQLLKHQIVTVFEKMGADEHSKVHQKLSNTQRKIIFSTDLAEDYLLIDGVVFVVDSGYKQDVNFANGTYNIKIIPISQNSAKKRAEKCGNTRSGTCYRLYSFGEYDKMEIEKDINDLHKIVKHDSLALAILTLQKLVPKQFQWIDTPSKESIMATKEELRLLGALDTKNELTEFGKIIVQVQLDPKLVKMMYSGCEHGLGYAAIKIASMLHVAGILFMHETYEETDLKLKQYFNGVMQPEGDIVTLYKLFENWMGMWNGTERKAGNRRELNLTNWCAENFVNPFAMMIAYSYRQDLLHQFKGTYIWKKVLGQSNVPTNDDICWLICSGYFLNAAILATSENKQNSIEYFAINSNIRGTLNEECALMKHTREVLEMPQWIIYDTIFYSSLKPIFLTVTSIEVDWIEEQSPEFYERCVKQEMSISEEGITKFVSQSCLTLMFGKSYVNLSSLEKELNCTIKLDPDSGRMDIQWTSKNKSTVENFINDKISGAVLELETQVLEEEYLNGTRVIIGKGFEILDVLFPRDYATLVITRLPKDYAPTELKWRLTQENETLAELEIKEHIGNTWSATAKFCTKKDAKSAYERLIRNKGITVFPKFGSKGQISQGMSTYLKLSWALEISNGIVNIEFDSAEDANGCIENIQDIIPHSAVKIVHGNLGQSTTPSNQYPKLRENQPPIFKFSVPYESDECRFRFSTNVKPSTVKHDFTYKITVAGIPFSMDEFEIKEALRRYNPKYVAVNRGKGRMERFSGKFQLPPNEKIAKLSALNEHLKNYTTTADFLESNTRRAGIYIRFNNNNDAKVAFDKTNVAVLGLKCNQPHRLEIEFTHSISINEDLLTFLESEFTDFKQKTEKRRITVTELPPVDHGKLSLLRFQTSRQSNILWVQEQLEKITACSQFTDENIDVLFTWPGRQQMVEVAETGYFHWNNTNNQGIWLYGSPEIKETIRQRIKTIIHNLLEYEILDKVVKLDKKKVTGLSEVAKMCTKYGVSFHHFLGNKLFLSGTKNSVEKVEKWLIAKNCTKIFNNIRADEEARECGLCFSIPEGPFIVTTLCFHCFCIECIEPLLALKPAPPLPITCPVDNCGVPVAIDDIYKCGSKQTLRSVLEVSVFAYQEQHSKEILLCPKPGCSQVLSLQSRTTGNKGGDFIFCDECVTTYCLTCSEKLCKLTKSHDISTCLDMQAGVFSEVAKHVKEIQESHLNLKCPRCKMAFVDFDGCVAIKCDKCNCGFCGLCLKDCQSDAHPHVKKCPKNPRGGYSVEIGLLNTIHKSMRKQKVSSYIQKIADPKIRNQVCESVRKDLTDLGIEEDFIKSLFVILNEGKDNKELAFEIQTHVRKIQDTILTLSCPRCKQAFYEFDGGVTVKCSYCQCWFCGLCFNECGTAIGAVSHVTSCRMNLHASPFVGKHIVDYIHNSIRKEKIKIYIEKISVHEIQTGVCKAIEKDLADLGIEKNFLKLILSAQNSKLNSNKPQNLNTRPGILNFDHDPTTDVRNMPNSAQTRNNYVDPKVLNRTSPHDSIVGPVKNNNKITVQFPQDHHSMSRNSAQAQTQSQTMIPGMDEFPILIPPKNLPTRQSSLPSYAHALSNQTPATLRDAYLNPKRGQLQSATSMHLRGQQAQGELNNYQMGIESHRDAISYPLKLQHPGAFNANSAQVPINSNTLRPSISNEVRVATQNILPVEYRKPRKEKKCSIL